jgi:hypothetical protein
MLCFPLIAKCNQACDWLHTFIRVKENIQPCSSTGKNHLPFISSRNSQKQTHKILTSYLQTFFLFRFRPLGLKMKSNPASFMLLKWLLRLGKWCLCFSLWLIHETKCFWGRHAHVAVDPIILLGQTCKSTGKTGQRYRTEGRWSQRAKSTLIKPFLNSH